MCLPLTPYKVEREWKAFGLSCAVVQNREAGHRCGYVRVPPGHPAHGLGYDSLDLDVHGGLTFAAIEPCSDHEDGQGWWLGFECNHGGDAGYDPSFKVENAQSEETVARLKVDRDPRWAPLYGGHFWTEAQVLAETERLAKQLARL